jgi:hypothetical protein
MRTSLSGLSAPVFSGPLQVTIDYSVTLESLMAELGCSTRNRSFNVENFSKAEQRDVRVMMVGLNANNASSEDVVHILSDAGLQAATLLEMLSFQRTYPDSCSTPLVAFGSIWRDSHGDSWVPCVGVNQHGRYAQLLNLNRRWYGFHAAALPRSAR